MHPDPGSSTQATARVTRKQSKPAQMYKFYPVFQIILHHVLDHLQRRT